MSYEGAGSVVAANQQDWPMTTVAAVTMSSLWYYVSAYQLATSAIPFHNKTSQASLNSVERVGWGVSYPGPRDIWGAPPSLRNIKYTRMYHFENKNFKNFSPEGPHNNVWGAHENCFPGPHCGSQRTWSGLTVLKSTFNGENVICRLSWSILSHCSGIRSWNACCSAKLRKIH